MSRHALEYFYKIKFLKPGIFVIIFYRLQINFGLSPNQYLDQTVALLTIES